MENIIVEIDDMLESTGLSVSTCRVRSLPYHSEVQQFIESHEQVIVLEINRDGQLFGILRKELPVNLLSKMHKVAYSDGLPPRAQIYSDLILETIHMEVSV
jgi:2-oxoglutarate ferredoxin oxidoreductase subunit alpha